LIAVEDSAMAASAFSTQREVRIDPGGLFGFVGIPEDPQGLVLFAHGSGSGRHSPRNNEVALALREVGIATLLLDLLTVQEEQERANVFDIRLLASRLIEATDWVQRQPETRDLPIGYFGASTGAGAALVAAAMRGPEVAAVVSRGGRPDLAGDALARVATPTLLIVGGLDTIVIDLNRQAKERIAAPCEIVIVPGAGHLFEEPGTLDQVIDYSQRWFLTQFERAHRPGVAT
jgi:putative phosphoribosyl transferase